MCSPKFNAKDRIANFNQLRERLSTIAFTRETFRHLLKQYKLPSNKMFFRELLNSGIIRRIGVNSYLLNTPKPIHYTLLQDIYDKYKVKIDYYNRNSRPIKREVIIKEPSEVIIENTDISKTISLLKDHGYLIYKPV